MDQRYYLTYLLFSRSMRCDNCKNVSQPSKYARLKLLFSLMRDEICRSIIVRGRCQTHNQTLSIGYHLYTWKNFSITAHSEHCPTKLRLYAFLERPRTTLLRNVYWFLMSLIVWFWFKNQHKRLICRPTFSFLLSYFIVFLKYSSIFRFNFRYVRNFVAIHTTYVHRDLNFL